MPFAPTITYDSETAPGVKFTVHRMGLGRRTDAGFAALKPNQRLRELEADYPPQSDREKELTEQLEIAKSKSLAVPEDQFQAVLKGDVMPLAEELAAAIAPEVKKARLVIDEEYKLCDAQVRAQWIRSGLISIDGGELDGMTPEQLLAYGPQELAQEIYGVLADDGKLRGAKTKNLQSPTTSGEVAGGESQSTTAIPAGPGPTPTTSVETASSTSPET